MIQRDQGLVKEVDKRFGMIRLDNGQAYHLGATTKQANATPAPLPEGAPTQSTVVWPDWIALGQRVRVTYDDASGGRDVQDIRRD